MTSTPSPPPPADPGTAYGFFDSLRRLNLPRSQERWIGGVAGGIAARLGIDPLIVRGIFLVITIFGGFGLLVYGICWALLPEASDGRIHLQEAIRGRFDAALVGAAVMAVIGLSRVGFWWDGWVGVPFMIGMIALVALAVVVVTAIRNSGSTPPGGPSTPPGGPSTPPGGPSTPPGGPSGPPGGDSPPPGGGTPPPTAYPGSGGHVPFSTAHPEQGESAGFTTAPGTRPAQITSGEPGAPATGSWPDAHGGGPWSEVPPQYPTSAGPAGSSDAAEQPAEEDLTAATAGSATATEAESDVEPESDSAGETEASTDPATAYLATDAAPTVAYPAVAPDDAPTVAYSSAAPEDTPTVPSAAATDSGHGATMHADQTATLPGHEAAGDTTAWGAGASAPPPSTPPPPPVTSPAPPPPAPPRRNRPGPGSALVRVTFGLALLATAALVLSAHYFDWQTSAWLIALGGGLVVLGLGATLAGILGRRSGSLAVIGTLLAIVLVPWAISVPVLTQYDFTDSSTYGDRYWSPQNADQAAEGYSLTGGAIRVDLSDLADEQITSPIEIELGAGEVELVVPDGMPVTVTASVQGETSAVNLSEWTAMVDDESRELGDRTELGWRFGTRPMTAELTSPEAEDATPIPVNIDVGFGAIEVRELR